MPTLKVYNVVTFILGKQYTSIVAAPSRKKAAELLDTSYGHLKDYGMITGNPQQIETAMAEPGTVFVRRLNDFTGDYRRKIDVENDPDTDHHPDKFGCM